MTNIPIDTLRSLLTILQTGSITAAANQLQLTQPAVTAQIKRLERLVGGPLFERSVITERGETVARYARRILATNDQLLSIVGGEPSAIRLGLPPILVAFRMHEVLTACREIEQFVKLDVEPSKVLEEKFANGFVDMALILSEYPKDNPVVAWSEEFAWMTSRDFEVRPGQRIPLLDFPDSISHQRAVEVLETNHLDFKVVLTSRDMATHLSMCESGRGVMVFPTRFVPARMKIAEWLPPIPDLHAGIHVREGFEREFLPNVIECIGNALRPDLRRNVLPLSSARSSK